MKTTILFGAAMILLAACAGEPSAPAPTVPSASAPAPGPAPEPDQCGAAEAQRFVGRPRSEIPAPVDPRLQRILCSTCAATMDYNPRRLNFVFDEKTGVVQQAKCG
ncbi:MULTISPECIES: peptidase inhibitor I78 [Phenylobacterium]|uniref:Peptidase inhibitor I78 n=1 Tax=Phenylobacterium koreense TaxID=266125 RepID=A0ABV2EK05_9CAUL